MTRLHASIGGLLVAALAAGTRSESPRPSVSRELGGYTVLAADFHVHSFPFSWSTLSSWGTVLEARHQGLDAVVLTPHNGHLWVARSGRWLSQAIGGPLVIVGEEIAAASYHMIAAGISEAIPARLSAAQAIEEVHRQGGVAIAAHPYEQFWPAYDAAALQTLDGAEIVRPESLHSEQAAAQLRAFSSRGSFAAIGSSDYHGFGTLGYARTYVFVRSRSEQELLAAVREKRTVVYGRDRAFGDPALIELAASSGWRPQDLPILPVTSAAAVFSRLATVLALAVFVLFNRW